MNQKPEPPPEAELIRVARQAAKIKAPAAARAAGISTARWSQIENGYESRGGKFKPITGTETTIAHMAHAVGLKPDRLARAGRGDAARILREILEQEAERESAQGILELDVKDMSPREVQAWKTFFEEIRGLRGDD